jgi:hypothetical protein
MTNSNGAIKKSIKVSPYYSSEEEKQLLISMRDAFEFDKYDSLPPSFVLLAGAEGVGKTHTACTMAELGPVYLLDTEFRAAFVTRKFENIKRASIKDFKTLVAAVKAIIQRYPPPGTIVIDSGSDIQKYAEIEYLNRTKMEKVYPQFNWSEVFAMCTALINDLRFAGYHIVMTSRLKEEYRNDKPTGEMVPRIYSEIPHKADFTIVYHGKGKNSKKLLEKNGADGDLSVELPPDINLPKLIQSLLNSKKG